MILCKSAAELEKMRRSGLLVGQILGELREMVQPGVSTAELERTAERRIQEAGARAAFKGYYGYPCVLCTSINNEIVHGIPSRDRSLHEGDILKVDIGVELDGYYGDSAVTIPVGPISPDLERLLRVTRESLDLAIHQVRVGNRLGDVCSAVQKHVEAHGYSVVRDFVGHGIGRKLHEDPQVPNFGSPGEGPRLREGMVMAIEPMVNTGSGEAQVLQDRWTAVTADGGYSAHFEHTVAVTLNGPWILTHP
jgi:methionyl aminopeptidase